MVFLGSSGFLVGFTCFYWVLLGFTGLYLVSLGVTGLLLGFTGCDRFKEGLNGITTAFQGPAWFDNKPRRRPARWISSHNPRHANERSASRSAEPRLQKICK